MTMDSIILDEWENIEICYLTPDGEIIKDDYKQHGYEIDKLETYRDTMSGKSYILCWLK